MPDPLRPINRPPAIAIRECTPQRPVVEVNLQCPEEIGGTFTARVVELDLDQTLRARWFLDYDLSGEGQDGPVKEANVEVTGINLRSAELLPEEWVDRASPGLGPHTLEVFIAEVDALEANSSLLPEWRALRDCEAEGYPEDCISTHPTSMRWTLDVIDEQCQ